MESPQIRVFGQDDSLSESNGSFGSIFEKTMHENTYIYDSSKLCV